MRKKKFKVVNQTIAHAVKQEEKPSFCHLWYTYKIVLFRPNVANLHENNKFSHF